MKYFQKINFKIYKNLTDKKWHTKQSATILKRQKISGNDVFFRGSYHKDVRRALSTNRCFLEVKSLIP